MVLHRTIGEGLGEVGLVDVVVVEHPDENGEIIVAVCLMYELLCRVEEDPSFLTDQGSAGENVLRSILDTKQATMLIAGEGPKEPGPCQRRAEGESPGSQE